MFRISNRMMYNNSLINAFRNNEGLLRAQEQISSGKRINRPSDDPVGMMEVLKFRTDIGLSGQYLSVMENAESFLNTADTVLGTVHNQLKTAKEQALQQAGGLATAETRKTAAIVIDNMVEQMIQLGNTRVGHRYLFSGQRSEAPALDANGDYTGSGRDLTAEITLNEVIPISVRASEFLTADMNPSLSAANGATPLASLNGGSGVPAGSFTITDRAGNSVLIDTTAMADLEDVITAINGGGTNITASISSNGGSLVLTDSSAPPTQPITVQANATSAALGIAGTRAVSVFTGDGLDPAITASTPISSLYGGQGMTLNDLKLLNGGASATVSFAGAVTVGDVVTALNTAGAPINVTAAIDAAGRKLEITSTNPATVAMAREAGTGATAEMLGIGGGRNVIPILKKLSAALKANDLPGILTSIDALDSVMDTTNSVRGAVGARVNHIITTRGSEETSQYDNTKLKSFVEDADYLAAASELAMLQTAYQATLKSASSIIQPSLLDFIR